MFGAHYADAVDTLFTAASRVGLRITSGLVVSDRIIRADLLTTPERAYTESLALAARWHGVGRNRYAVTPRFSLSCTDELLAACTTVLDEIPGALFTSHLNENEAEIATVAELFGGSDYVSTYERHGLVDHRSVLRPQRPPDRCRAQAARPERSDGRALPDEQRRTGQRTVPARAGISTTASESRSVRMSAPVPASRC